MAEDLKSVKSRVAERHLGRHGIHGIGVRHSQSAISLYVRSKRELEASGALAEIEKDAAPFKVLVIEAEPASSEHPPSEPKS